MASENRAALTWAANGESDLAGYVIYAGRQPSVSSISSGLIATNSYTFNPPSNGDGLWHFQVSAVDTSGNESAQSAQVTKRIVRVSGALTRVR